MSGHRLLRSEKRNRRQTGGFGAKRQDGLCGNGGRLRAVRGPEEQPHKTARSEVRVAGHVAPSSLIEIEVIALRTHAVQLVR